MILGHAVIRVNGTEIKSKSGATLNPGGFQRTPHNGAGKSWGYSRKWVNPSLECVIAADEDVDVIEINAIEEASITFEGDNGLSYLITKAAPQDPAPLNEDSGDIKVTFIGSTCKKI
jgi:hypothetical protein